MADEKKVEGPATKPYVLKPGRKFQQAGVRVAPGSTVELTETQYRAFRDAFDPAGEKPSYVVKSTEPPPADGSGTGAGAVGPSHIPQDVGAATHKVDTNPGNQIPIGSAPVRPGTSAANTSAATGSVMSPPPPGDVAVGATVAAKGEGDTGGGTGTEKKDEKKGDKK